MIWSKTVWWISWRYLSNCRPRGIPAYDWTARYGSSGNFFSQLVSRAPFDVYLSADLAYPEELAERGLAAPDSLFEYAVGRIVVWVPAASPLDVETLGMEALRDPSVRRIAIANPAPCSPTRLPTGIRTSSNASSAWPSWCWNPNTGSDRTTVTPGVPEGTNTTLWR